MIFIIEKGWIDPMENRDAHGYNIFGYTLSEERAKDFCDAKGFWTQDDCWSIRGKIPKFRYKKVGRKL